MKIRFFLKRQENFTFFMSRGNPRIYTKERAYLTEI